MAERKDVVDVQAPQSVVSAQDRSELKEQLLAKLKATFIQHGYEGTTLTRMAAASGLGKASLYHHFPGGKKEIAGILVRAAVNDLQTRVFAPVAISETTSKGKPAARAARARSNLTRLIDRFVEYVDHGDGHCLLMLFAQERAPGVNHHALREQFEAWSADLSTTFETVGHKPKTAKRAAADLLNQLYGGLVLCRALNEPRILRQTAKRLKKTLAD